MNSLRLLIVDDESLIRSGIRAGLSAMEDVTIVGECETGAEATESIRVLRPDLVLLDVQLPDCSGLDVLRRVGVPCMPMVIFITAHDQYAVKAFEMNAVDYLLKPFDEERLRNSIERARDRIAVRDQATMASHLQALLEKEQAWPERISVRNGDHYEFVRVDAIDWIESANNYVQLYCGRKTYLLSETLTAMGTKLDPKKFLRVHRCRIVNISRIASIHSFLNGTYKLELCNGTRLTTGRQYKHDIQALIRS